MNSAEIRSRFLKFFENKGHKVIPSASLVPQNDPSVLFTTAGMQQFKPYFLGIKNAKTDFDSLNTASVQKCIRTSDIEEVGDDSHLTFFEMLGNFSFGGYWKKEAIQYGYDFITKELGLAIDYISVFGGEDGVEPDTESEEIWKKVDSKLVIKRAGRADNFWGPTGEEGPCGPTTEIYVDGLEVWNIVFNQFYQNKNKTLKPLEIKGIDTGMGLERLVKVIQKAPTVYDTDLFEGILNKIEELSVNRDVKSKRILADHVKAAVFMIVDGVTPSNTERGYILRRLIRRAVLQADKLEMKHGALFWLAETVIEMYKNVYPEILKSRDLIKSEIDKEEQKFRKTLEEGIKEISKLSKISGERAFDLYQSYGVPLEVTKEIFNKPIENEEAFFAKMKEHQELSRSGAEKKFKGGLADTSEMSVKYHTTTHLLNAALRQILGKEVMQKGSNITPERLRFDFTYTRKMTDEEKKQVEDLVNEKIKEDLPVIFTEMPKEEAEKTGAIHAFGEKYGDMVKVYSIGDEKKGYFSREFCGGPHVEHTGVLGHFKISKEEAVSAGVRRIKAVLE